MKTVWIDDNLHDILKHKGIDERRTVAELVRDSLYQYLNIDRKTGEQKDLFKIKDE